jgi:DNA-binding transcriptional regulator YhcF (GntR family)
MNRKDAPVVTIDSRSPTPPYEQIRLQLAQQIGDRTLPVGAKLPTVRALAADLGLAVNTVARAYRELEEAGIIETRGRSGSFVSAGGELTREQAQRAAMDYARLTAGLGLDSDEALRIVEAAIRAIKRP